MTAAPIERSAARATERSAHRLMLAPYVVGLLLLVGLPAVMTLAMSFTDSDLITTPRFVGADNYRDLVADPVFLISLRNSLGFILWAVPLRFVGVLSLALLLHRRSGRRRARGVNAARASVVLPSVMPDVAFAIVWLWILNPIYGPLNALLRSLGGTGQPWLSQPGPARASVVIMSLFLIGEGFVIAQAARGMIPGDLYELARMEGASPWQSFRRVTLPLMYPALLLLLLRDTIMSFQVSFIPALLVTDGGPPFYSTTYLPLFIYRTGFEYLRYGYASAATMVMILETAAIVWLQFDLLTRWRKRSLFSIGQVR